jgi:hypothetical protein
MSSLKSRQRRLPPLLPGLQVLLIYLNSNREPKAKRVWSSTLETTEKTLLKTSPVMRTKIKMLCRNVTQLLLLYVSVLCSISIIKSYFQFSCSPQATITVDLCLVIFILGSVQNRSGLFLANIFLSGDEVRNHYVIFRTKGFQ